MNPKCLGKPECNGGITCKCNNRYWKCKKCGMVGNTESKKCKCGNP